MARYKDIDMLHSLKSVTNNEHYEHDKKVI